jgi:hypothetical protein
VTPFQLIRNHDIMLSLVGVASGLHGKGGLYTGSSSRSQPLSLVELDRNVGYSISWMTSQFSICPIVNFFELPVSSRVMHATGTVGIDVDFLVSVLVPIKHAL